MNKIYYITAFLLFFSTKTISQNDLIQDAQFFATPNVASFNKFEDIPVSHYSGNPNISIPIYNIQDGDINIPISLRYHGSGIRIEEEASWVGLGWNLNAGGSITCRVNGTMDEVWYDNNTTTPILAQAVSSPNYYSYSSIAPKIWGAGWDPEAQKKADESYSALYGDSFYPPAGAPPYMASMMMYGYYKPDIYSFSTPFLSGKFYKNYGDGNFYLINGKEPLLIESNDDWKWIITDGNGIKYYFNTPQERQGSYGNEQERSKPITYYLDKILYPNGQQVFYTYNKLTNRVYLNNSITPTTYNAILEFIDNHQGGCSSSPSCVKYGIDLNSNDYIGESYTPTYLSEIETSNIKVKFNLYTATSREDIPGEYYLENVQVVDKSNGNIKKQFQLDYGYFNEQHSTQNAKLYKRLKLNKFIDNLGKETSFTYNPEPLPSKRSYGKDYWGYCNGTSGEQYNIPDLEKLYRNGTSPFWLDDILSTSRYQSATKLNMGTEPDKIKSATLERINYPTGGYVDFEFEPHTFSNNYYEKKDVTELIVVIGSQGTNSVPFTVDKARRLKVNTNINGYDQGVCANMDIIQLLSNCYVELYADGVLQERFISNALHANDFFYYDFVPGVQYEFVSYVDPNIETCGSVNISMQYWKKDNWSIGGGLRIKGIKHYTKDGMLSKHKRYTYEEGDISFGKLLSPLNFTEFVRIPCAYCNSMSYYETVRISSRSNIAISNSAGGSAVGYDKVIEETIGGVGCGKIIRYYHNEQDLINPFCPNISDLQNGLLIKSEIYDNDKKLETSTIIYEKLIENSYFGFGGSAEQYDKYQQYFTSQQIILFSYLIPADLYVPEKTTQTSYFYSENGSFIDSMYSESINEYNTLNFQLSKTTINNSKGQVIVTKKKYPLDYDLDAFHPISMMANKSNHIVLPVVEEQLWQDGFLISGKLTEFADFYGSYKPSKVHVMETANESSAFGQNPDDVPPYNEFMPAGIPYEHKLTIDYGPLGKIKEQKKTGGIPTTYIWGYNNQYPTAKIIGISFDNIPDQAINEFKKLDQDGIELSEVNNAIRTALPNCIVSTYTYEPLIGMKTHTDPNGNTVFYDYDQYGRLETIKDNNNKILNNYQYFLQQSFSFNILSISYQESYNEGDIVDFDVVLSGNYGSLSYNWELMKDGVVKATSNATVFNHLFNTYGQHKLKCEVVDGSNGKTVSKSVDFYVEPNIVSPIISGPDQIPSQIGVDGFSVECQISNYGSAEYLEYEISPANCVEVPSGTLSGSSLNINITTSGIITIKVRGVFGDKFSGWAEHIISNFDL